MSWKVFFLIGILWSGASAFAIKVARYDVAVFGGLLAIQNFLAGTAYLIREAIYLAATKPEQNHGR